MSQPIRKWEGRAAQDALLRIKQLGYANDLPCCICEQLIDYRLPSTDPDGCTVQHIKPRSTHPHLTWDVANHAPAHSLCNKSAQAKTPQTLGTTSREW